MTDERVFWRRRQMSLERPPRHENPYFPKDERRARSRFLSRSFWIILLALLLGGVGWILWGGFFQLDYIIVEGNAYIPTAEFVNRATERAQQKIFKIFPANTLLLSTTQIATRLQQDFGEQAIQQLTVKKRLPSALVISVSERVPNLVYTTGSIAYLLDRSGTVVRQIAPKERVNPTFPKLLDQTTRTVAAAKQLVSERAVEFLFTLQSELADRSDIPLDVFYLPPARCLAEPEPPAPAEEGSDADDQADGDSSNSNISANRNRNVAVNAVTANQNSNTAPKQEKPVGETCDLEQQALLRRELRVRSSEDWEIYFRSDDSAATQVTRLLRVLEEKHLDRAKLDYIDLRFGERVIIK
ncbi:MAG: hypothetical protein HY340_01705 [Candidatus Kerfeldbacteria bacterium]|nr:hypothetical protein [Candidatus Kerfeldbacteria bacterium]